MGLGSRSASRHETARVAGVDTSLWWDYKPGQRVMTVDGYAGQVVAVQDGPHPGNEAYDVVLDGGMGGGLYASSQLRPENKTTASTEKTAADDYPELGDILESRPDIAHNTVLASKTAAQHWPPVDAGDDHRKWWSTEGKSHEMCPICGGNGQVMYSGDKSRVTFIHSSDPGEDYEGASDFARQRDEHSLDAIKRLRAEGKTAAMWQEGKPPPHWVEVERRDTPCPHCGSEWVSKTGSCFNCGKTSDRDPSSLNIKERSGDSRPIEAAYNPWKTESPTKCPNCDSPNAEVQKDGTVACPDCGMGHTAAGWHRKKKHKHPAPIPCPRCGGVGMWMDLMEDGDHHACPVCNGSGTVDAGDAGAAPATTAAKGDPGWVSCPDCGLSTPMKKPGDSCPLCEGQLTAQPDKYADTKVIDTRTAAAREDVDYNPYGLLTLASIDPDFRFHFTAGWKDVQAKAKRLRTDGQVRIVAVGNAQVAGEVKGDHHVYATSLQYVPSTQRIAMWECGCKWASYSWGRSGPWKRYEGRMCSHALALQYEAQSRGMFGQTVWADEKSPEWLKARTRVVIEYDKDRGQNVSRPATPRQRDMNKYHSTLTTTPMDDLIAHAIRRGEVGETVEALVLAGCNEEMLRRSVAAGYRAPRNSPGNHPHGGPEVNADMGSFDVCSKCHGMGCAACGWDGLANAHSASYSANDALQSIHPDSDPLPAGHQPAQNPAQSGFLTAPDPWFGHDERYSDTLGIDTAAAFEPHEHDHDPDGPLHEPVHRGDDPWAIEPHPYVHNDEGYCEDCGSSLDDPAHAGQGQHFDNPHYNPHAPKGHGYEIPGVGPYGYHATETREQPYRGGDVSHSFEPDYERLHSLNALAPFPPFESLSGPVQGDPYPVPPSLAHSLGLGAELNDEPEGALPETDGTSTDSDDEQSDMDRTANFMTVRGPMCVNCGPNFLTEGPVTSLGVGNIEGKHCVNCGVPLHEGAYARVPYRGIEEARGTDSIVAAFQRQASHLAVEGRPSDNSDIAAAAREALGKMALKDFTPAEQMALISEGEREGVTASNLDRLDIAGTHYEQLEAALAANDEDDEGWMA